MLHRLALALILFLPLVLGAAPGTSAPSDENALAADYSAARLLAAAQASVRALAGELDPQSRDIQYRAALTSLTGLYQLHGCQWARPKLVALSAQPDFPESYYAITADGRLAVSIDRLDLRNAAFDGYQIFLCTLESLTAETLKHDAGGYASLRFILPGGVVLDAEELGPLHPLWEQLQQLAPTFLPPDVVYPGSGIGFKQLFSVPKQENIEEQSLVISWGRYQLKLPASMMDQHD